MSLIEQVNAILVDTKTDKRQKVLAINNLVGLDAQVKMKAMRAAQTGETSVEVNDDSTAGPGGVAGAASTPDGGVLRIFHAGGSRAIRCIWLLHELNVDDFEVVVLDPAGRFVEQMRDHGLVHATCGRVPHRALATTVRSLW